ncbi:MAG: Rieske 2Fe-2S domain-containing protein [Acidobacteriota bacterium]
MEIKEEKNKIVRRHFLDYLLGIGIFATIFSALYPIIKFVFPPEQAEAIQNNVVAGKVGELPLNSGKIFRFGNDPAILINTSAGELKAFSARCTHLDCTVQYRNDLKYIWCACHNGHYDLTGKNIAGPPPRPLEEYLVTIRADEIVVSKKG